MLRNKQKFKKGATSIYVVVIATLLFSVVTVSFIRIIINETNKTTSDELAQSAYDSALAGVEDAKVALKQYYECVDAGDALEGEDLDRCNRVKDNINNGFRSIDITDQSDPLYGYCDAVSQALGRYSSTGGAGEVLIKEEYDSTINEDHIVQAYTCVTVDNSPSDYRSTLGANDTIRVIPLKTENPNGVTGIRISWYTEDDGPFNNLNYGNKNNFISLSSGSTPTPPTLSAQIVQTAKTFTIGQFDNSEGDKTNRGTVFLVPDSPKTNPFTHVSADIVVKSNNHDYGRADHNEPQKINCQSGLSDSFACVASIELPDPVPNGSDAERNADTFFLVLTLPYGQPTTTFSVQLCTDEAEAGGTQGHERGDCRKTNGDSATADFKDVQIAVDSTGRANDMYSRVEARVEFRDIYFPFPEFAIQATGSDEDAIKKNFYVTDNCIKQDSSGRYVPCGTDTGPGN